MQGRGLVGGALALLLVVEVVRADDGVRISVAASVAEDAARVSAVVTAPSDLACRLRWIVAASEDVRPGTVLLEEDQALAAGAPLTVEAAAPPEGFATGAYRVEVLVKGRVVAVGTFAVTPLLPPAARGGAGPGDGANLAAAKSGGAIRRATSQADDTEWSATNLIDGIVDGTRADRSPSRGWAGVRGAPEEIVFSFHDDREAAIAAVVVDLTTSDAGDHPARLAKHVEVWTTIGGLGDGWRRVAAARLRRMRGEQRIAMPPATRARYVMLRFLSGYGEGIEVGEVKILEAAGVSILRDRPAKVPPPGDDDPVPLLGDQAPPPEDLARARPLRVNFTTDLRHDGVTQWFKITVAGAGPAVLHIGTVNVAADGVRVYDAGGTGLVARAPPVDRAQRWHGRVAPGVYYLRLDWADGASKPPPGKPKPGSEPAVVVLLDRVEARPTPAGAAQLGLDYLEIDTAAWQAMQKCFGCHMQEEALVGMAVAKKHSYRVNERIAIAMGEFVAEHGHHDMDPREIFRQAALRYYVEGFAPAHATTAEKLAKQLLDPPPERWELETGARLPVEGSAITSDALAVQVLAPLTRTASPSARAAFVNAEQGILAYLDGASLATVQDRIMRILAYAEAGRTAALAADVTALLALQNADGGWGEKPGGGLSNAYGTGQALYALKVAGFAITDPRFKKGVTWLMDRQRADGSWANIETESTTEIAHTMWAVIGLAGAIDKANPVLDDARMLVPLRLLARDARNQALTDLALGDFTVKEDGRPQQLVELYREIGELSVVLVMDNSGSIKHALAMMVEAARGFLAQLDPADRVSLLAFGDRPRPPTELATGRDDVAKELASMRAKGGTALYDAVASALAVLAAAPEPRAIVLLTDGKDENEAGTGPGSTATLAQTLERLRTARVPVYIIGLGDAVEHKVLDSMAEASGGTAYYVASDAALAAIYHDIAAALRARYVLVFRSSHPVADGSWRAIEVGTSRPNAKLQAPAGYLATPDLLQ
jgi:VWFA-related protein